MRLRAFCVVVARCLGRALKRTLVVLDRTFAAPKRRTGAAGDSRVPLPSADDGLDVDVKADAAGGDDDAGDDDDPFLFTCDACPYVTPYKFSFFRHQRVPHDEASLRKLILCPYCPHTASDRNNLRVHLQRRHHGEPALEPVAVAPLSCPRCSFTTMLRATLLAHEARNQCSAADRGAAGKAAKGPRGVKHDHGDDDDSGLGAGGSKRVKTVRGGGVGGGDRKPARGAFVFRCPLPHPCLATVCRALQLFVVKE